MTFAILLSFCVFMMSLLGTRITIMALRQREAMLAPLRALKGHAAAKVPSGGGVTTVMALLIGLLVADAPYVVALSVLLLASVSLMDELIDVPGLVHVLIQFLAVLLPMELFSAPLLGDFLPPWADRAVVALLWLWFINVFEFMDGIDGITPTEMIAIGMGLVFVVVADEKFPSPLSMYGLVVFAVASGFLWWNWYPSKIRLGEVGTVPIGFLMGYVLLLAIEQGYWAAAAILPAYYMADASLTMLYRALKGKRALAKHGDYYYRRATAKGRKADTVCRYVFGLNLLLMLLATFSVINPEMAVWDVAVAYMAVFMVLGFFAYTPHNPEHEPF